MLRRGNVLAIGAYEAVWLFVGFDLPTLTKEDRKRAHRFRQDLLDLGFSMFQLSFYKYYFPSHQKAESVAKRIENLIPANGKVCVFFITDKQFGMIKTYCGGKIKAEYPPEQGLLFL